MCGGRADRLLAVRADLDVIGGHAVGHVVDRQRKLACASTTKPDGRTVAQAAGRQEMSRAVVYGHGGADSDVLHRAGAHALGAVRQRVTTDQQVEHAVHGERVGRCLRRGLAADRWAHSRAGGRRPLAQDDDQGGHQSGNQHQASDKHNQEVLAGDGHMAHIADRWLTVTIAGHPYHPSAQDTQLYAAIPLTRL